MHPSTERIFLRTMNLLAESFLEPNISCLEQNTGIRFLRDYVSEQHCTKNRTKRARVFHRNSEFTCTELVLCYVITSAYA